MNEKLIIPTSILENKKYRLNILNRAEDDLVLRELIKKKCSLNIEFAWDLFFWTYDDRETNPNVPYVLYPKQRDLITELDNNLILSRKGEKVNFILDKPRAVGATYTVMAWILYHWLFSKGFTARVGSRKEDYVDKRGEKDTLFVKLDYILDRFPNWLKPKYRRASMMLDNEENGNTVSGESANPNFARGGRKSVILFDELGFWDWAGSSWESAGESSNYRIAMSTPPDTGKDSYFHKLLIGEKGRIRKFNFDWQDVPGRDDKWFKEAKETKSPEEFAREVLKSYDGTTKGKVYAHDMRLVELKEIEYTGRLPLYIAWDFGLDSVAMIWIQVDLPNKKFYVIDSYINSNKAIDFFVPFVNGTIKSGIEKYNEYELNMIMRHKLWNRTITHYGDPSVKQRHISSGLSARDILEDKHNIYIQSKDWSGRKWTDIRDITRTFFRDLTINTKLCESFISALRMSRYPERAERSQATSEPLKPIHDSNSHYRSAFEYFCDNIYDEEEIKIVNDYKVEKYDTEVYVDDV